MNATIAKCGHTVVAVGAPGSAARAKLENEVCQECADRIKFETTTEAFTVDSEDGRRTVTIAEARAVFDKYHKAPHWKDPVNVLVPYSALPVFLRAVTFYQGCNPEHTLASAKHWANPAEDITTAVYRVTSPGYVC